MYPTSSLRRQLSRLAEVVAAAMLLAGTALAAGPRWTTGSPYYQNNNGSPVVWYTTQPQYFTDPGDLSAYVNHAAADAMVASAAATWNIASSSLTLAQGGALNEHVSSANVYLGSSGPVFPSDVQASNYPAKQIAVIYDSDGSVTDTLLGGGASDPGNCRQSAVTESVDSISTSGQILHALLILNGRCTGSASALQMEMKYRLVRAFGRVLGLGWSQLNDNVFTGTPQPTSQQSMNWPVMHPIDVLCGPYAYQCMVQPFTLRTDDMASLVSIYPVSTDGNGKTGSFDNAASLIGFVNFPNGQGMEGVLVSVRRFHFGPGYTDAFDLTSAVTGATFQQTAGNLVTPKDNSLAESNGSSNQYYEGYYTLGWIPIPTTDYFDNLYVTTSAINPLYTGQYAVGPYITSQVTPSGPPLTGAATVINRGYTNVVVNMTATSAPATCSSGGDGSVNAPLTVASSGSWSDTLCGYQHSAWSALAVKSGRSLTMEVTATDEQGYATTGKMLPVIGVWDSNDSSGVAPTLASQAAALNASTLGMTNLMVSSSTARTMRIGIADQRGDGRPDYGYNARILYADSISPASLPANGGVVTIAGMGFHPGNTVTINGVAANVTSWTATSITLVAPPITGPLAADVVVTDLSTGGQTTMSGALTYSQTSSPDVLTVISKPADGGYIGNVGSPLFQVQVMLPDGVTPAARVAVTFSSTMATFGACSNAPACTLTTDASGFASSLVTPTAAGTVMLTATVGSSAITATFIALAIPVDGLAVTSLPSGTVYATLPASAPFSVKVTLPGSTTAAAGASVVVTATNAALGGCSGASTCTLIADASGMISTTVTPSAAGVVSLLATAGGGMVSASFGATALPADVLRVVSKPADGSYVGRTATTPFALQVMLGDNATPASGVAVTLTATGATLTACGTSTCVLAADSTGSVSTSVVPASAGTVTLAASAGGGSISTTFNSVVVPPDVLHTVSRPADGSYIGRTAATPFSVQVALGDTGAAAAGISVTVSTNDGILNACGAPTCTLTADSTGTISTTVTPSVAGTVTLAASAGGGTLSVSFLAVVIPPDTLTILTKPANGSYVGRTATVPFAVQTFSGDTGAPASAVAITLSATNATLSACSGASSCTLAADSSGTISTIVTPTTVGTVSLSASAGGGTTSTTFSAVAVPPDALHVVSQPANGSYVGRVAATSFAVQVALGDTGGPATGASVSVSAINAVLNACGAATCTLIADSTGTISTTVTPSSAGTVTLTASAGGGTVSTTFNAVVVPPDTLRVVTQPANGSYVGRTATMPFAVQVALGDTGAAAAGVSVTLSATNALLNACGATTCTLTADSTGTVSTTVTPAAVGSVALSATAGGGTASVSFNAIAIPPDALHIVANPADGSYVGTPAAVPFTVQVALGDTGAPAANISAIVSATNATLNTCGAATCTLTTDSTGAISTTVTPTTPGTVTLSASAGGGSVSSSFLAAAIPPDTLNIITRPADGAYTGRVATLPFSVQIFDGETGAPAAGASIMVTATGATLAACGDTPSCVLTADSTGTISTTLTPSLVGVVSLSAAFNGSAAGVFFNAIAVPPDTLTIITQPASGSYAGRPAAVPFSVQVALGDTGGPASAVSVTVSATNAVLGACSAATCTLTADSTGTISTTVTPSAAGAVSLAASAGGGTVSTTFNAVDVPPDVLRVVTQPANGSYVGRASAIPFYVQIALGDTGAPAAGASVSVSATNATLTACGASTCTLTADLTGTISTTVTPAATGSISLTAAVGGGSVTATFNAVAVPPDVLHVLTQPATGSYVGRVATFPFSIQVAFGDTGTAAGGVSVSLTATNAVFSACAASTCSLTTDSTGTITTTVTPSAVGSISLAATAGGGTVSTTFIAAAIPPDSLLVVTAPTDNTYIGSPSAIPFAVSVFLGDGVTPASGATITLTSAGATFGACGLSTCTLTANTLGAISATVTAIAAGVVTLTASAGGGTVSTTFTAISSPDNLQILSAPSDHSLTNQVAATPLVVKATLGFNSNARLHTLTAIPGTPDSGQVITLTAVGGKLNACGLPTCVLIADSNGTVTTTVTPLLPGTVTLLALGGGGTVSTAFAADTPPDTLHITSTPANGSYANRVAAAPFALQVLLGDGVTPASGASVTLAAAGATLGACGLSTCVVIADASGSASTSVTPSAIGPVQLTASAGGGTATASFTSAAVPPDALHVTTQPANGSYAARTAATPFTVQTLLGDTNGPAAGASVTLSAANATFGACGLSTCLLTADANGAISTTVNPTTTGTVQLTASAGGGTTTTTFTAVAVPSDTLQVISHPADGSYVARTAASPFTVQVLLGDTGGPAIGIPVTIFATGATFGACGSTTCTLTTDSTGTISTTVTPTAAGTVTLTASAGGGTVTTTFTAAAVPPDTMQVLSHPADGSYAGSVAATRFAVQTLLGDTNGPAAGASVTVTASNATLGACGTSTCIFTADSTGTISTTVTPLAAGPVGLLATAGGGTVSSSFNAAAAPVDILHIVAQPSGAVYATLPAATPFTVQVLLPDGTTPAPGTAVTLSAIHATFGSCGGSTSCVLPADASGTVSTTVTPQQSGILTLQATAGGGIVSTTFTASTLPANIVSIVSAPSGSVYVGIVAASRFTVHVLLGDGVTPAAAAPVTLTAAGATFGSCASTCILTTDASGNISTTVTPTTSGTVNLTASSGGGTASTTFEVTPDILRVVSSPASNSYSGSPATSPFAIQVLLGDGATPVIGTGVNVTSSNATLGACALTTCTLITDGQGMISTLVTAIAPGMVSLTASAAGVTVSTSFTAAAPPDALQVLSTPTNGSYVGRSSTIPFIVQVTAGNATNHVFSAFASPQTALPILSGVAVTLSATGATLDACGLASCTLTTGALGTVSTTVTPTTAGSVTLAASAAGGTTSSSFAAATPPNVLHAVSVPANGTYFGRVATTPFAVQVLQNDGTMPASSVSVALTSTGAILGACGQSTCTLLSDPSGMVATTVTPLAAGTVILNASASGGTTSASFTAAAPPDVVSISSTPASGAYTGRPGAQPFNAKVLLGDAVTPAAGASVTLTASNAILGACGLATCTSTADATGSVSTTVIPLVAGTVALTASAAGGTASASFTAVDPVRSISISRTTEFVATGSAVLWTPTVTLLENGVPAPGIPVTWSSQPGLNLAATTSTTNPSGVASLGIAIGPLATGSTPTGTACAWTTVCATFDAQAVDAPAWRLVTVSGTDQTASPVDTLQPVTIRAVDDAGDWIAGVTIQLNQLVRGWVVCPPTGRCPLGPVLSSAGTTLISDVDGLAAITPLQVPNTAQTTGIVAAAGPDGYVSVSLSKVP